MSILETYQQAKSHATEELKILVQDKSSPLDGRWELWLKHGENLGNTGGYIWRPSCDVADILEDSYTGDGSPSRYETVETNRWIEWIEDDIQSNGSDGVLVKQGTIHKYDGSPDEKVTLTLNKELIDTIKEEILEDFQWSYEFDW